MNYVAEGEERFVDVASLSKSKALTLCFVCALRSCKVYNLNLGRSNCVAPSLFIAVIDFNVNAEDGVRAGAFRVASGFCDDSNLFTKLKDLLHIFDRANLLACKILNNNFSFLVAHFKVALVGIEQVINTFVVNLHIAHTDRDLALDHTARGD